MGKILLVIATSILTFSGGLSAAPLCTDPGIRTLGDLITNGGCMLQDKLFSFDAGSYTGGGSITAGDVGATVVFNSNPGQDLHGWVFTPTANWTSGFIISYTISVLPAFPDVSIQATTLQMNGGSFPGSPATAVNMTQNGGALPSLDVNFLTAGNETAIASYSPATSIAVVNTATIPSGKALVSLENDFTEVTSSSTVPEPATAIMLGSALLCLGMLVRSRLGRVSS